MEEPLNITSPVPSLILEDSDHSTFGLVKDTQGDLTWKSGEGLLVGQWSRSPLNGCYHLWLEKSVDALHDERLQWWRRVIAEREARELPGEVKGVIKRNRYTPAPKRQVVLDPVTKQFRMI